MSVEVVAARVTDHTGSAGYAVVCRYVDAENYYVLAIDDDGYWNIDRVVAGVPTTLNSYVVDDPGIRDGAFTVRGDCSASGGGVELALWLDGELIATARDEDDPLPPGPAGFAFYNLHGWEGDLEARFEQVRMWVR